MTRKLLPFLMALACVSAVPPVAGAQDAPSTQAAAKLPPLIVNLNSATVEQLATLPGIGEKTAQRIIEYRQKNGPFKKPEDLMNVKGIGEKSFLKLKSQLTVAPAKPERTTSQSS